MLYGHYFFALNPVANAKADMNIFHHSLIILLVGMIGGCTTPSIREQESDAVNVKRIKMVYAEALSVAQSMAVGGVERSQALSYLVPLQIKSGDLKGALLNARANNSSTRSIQFIQIVSALAEAGDIEAALSVAKEITHTKHRAKALGNIAHTQAVSGNIGGALSTIEKIDKSERGGLNIQFTISTVADSGDTDGARAISETIWGEASYVYALHKIAKAQLKAGKNGQAQRTIADALKVIRSDKNALSRVDDLKTVISAQAFANDINGIKGVVELALVSAKLIRPLKVRVGAVVSLADSMSIKTHSDIIRLIVAEARSIARAIENSSERDWSLSLVSLTQGVVGDLEGAVDTIMMMGPGKHRDGALSLLVWRHAENGNFLAADEKSVLIDNRESRDQANLSIARSLAQRGDYAGALKITSVMGDRREQDLVRYFVAFQQATAGDPDDALKTANMIKSSVHRSKALFAALTWQAKNGNLRDAQAIEKEITYVVFRVKALISIYAAQIKANAILGSKATASKALALAKTIKREQERTIIIGEIATAQAEFGNVEDAISTARSVTTPYRQIRLLIKIIPNMELPSAAVDK